MINNSKATLGGGCFWCIEAVFKRIEGVQSVYPGYCGGPKNTANYKDVCKGDSGHAEVVQVSFDAKQLNYQDLLKVFFMAHDPTTLNRQGNDEGEQYKSVIFYHDELQKKTAMELIEQMNKSGYYKSKIVTQISPLIEFYRAEDKHLDYYDQNPKEGYCRAVIAPKVSKIVKQFNDRIKAAFK